jgi:hypothetical protein
MNEYESDFDSFVGQIIFFLHIYEYISLFFESIRIS